jgi:cytochrome oxidase assembly protein ShyY1
VRSLRFLVSRRWALFALTVVVLAYATWWLGEWQFHRLADRKESNAVVRANETRDAAPVADVLAPGREVREDDEWRLVTATGTYATDDTVIVRYRTRDGASGIDVVVPLATSAGPSLLVDRGWMPADNRGADRGDVPAPPSGTVTVTGWVRADGTGDSTQVTDASTRAISSDQIGPALDREVYGGFVELRSEDPPAADALEPVELPELDNGPHFFYGLQWWFFGVLAVFGFFYLAYDEWRHGPRGQRERDRVEGQSARSMPPSTGSIAPETKEAAGESRKAAARPNSSGSP